MEGSASVVRRSSVQRSRSPSNASESSVKSIVPDGLTAPADHKLTVQKCFISMQPWEDVDLKKEALRRSLTAPVVPVSLVLGDEGRLVPADPELHPVCPETGSAYVRNLRSVGSRGHKHDTDCPNRRCYWANSDKGCSKGWACDHCHYCSAPNIKVDRSGGRRRKPTGSSPAATHCGAPSLRGRAGAPSSPAASHCGAPQRVLGRSHRGSVPNQLKLPFGAAATTAAPRVTASDVGARRDRHSIGDSSVGHQSPAVSPMSVTGHHTAFSAFAALSQAQHHPQVLPPIGSSPVAVAVGAAATPASLRAAAGQHLLAMLQQSGAKRGASQSPRRRVSAPVEGYSIVVRDPSAAPPPAPADGGPVGPALKAA